jgi:hypothetical protein
MLKWKLEFVRGVVVVDIQVDLVDMEGSFGDKGT